MAGLVLNMLPPRQQIPWTDPVVLSSSAMLVWLVAAGLFNALYRPARRGRKVAYLTVVSFLFLLVSLTVALLFETRHGVTGPASDAAGRRASCIAMTTAETPCAANTQRRSLSPGARR